MTDVVPRQVWWRLSCNGHAVDPSFWWDRVRMWGSRNRPHLKRLWSMSWYGRCTPYEFPVISKAWTWSGLNKKSDANRSAHRETCSAHDNV